MPSFQEILLKLEGKSVTSCDLFAIMGQLRKSLTNKVDDSFFGMKVKMAIWKNYLHQPAVEKFKCEALAVYRWAIDYLQKWLKFDKSPYRHFSALSIHSASKSPTVEISLKFGCRHHSKKKLPQTACMTK